MLPFKAHLRSIFAAFLLLGAGLSVCMAQPLHNLQKEADSILVVVDNDVITKKELNTRVNMIAARLKQQNIHPPREELERQVLEHMIIESAQLQMARERGIRIDDRQLDATIAMIADQNRMSVAKFAEQLQKDGTSLAAFRESIRNDLIRQRLREIDVDSRIEISDSEVLHLLEIQQQSPAAAQPAFEVHLGHILIRIPENASSEQIAGRQDRAEHVLRNLRAGGNFQQNAATYSDADDGLTGGDMGWRSSDRLPSLFVDAVTHLQAGQISGILKSPSGFHILKVLGRRDTAPPVAEPHHPRAMPQVHAVQQIHARHILIRVNQLVTADEARRRLVELKERLDNRAATFEELARTHSNDASAARGGDLGWIYAGDTVPEFEQALNTLQIGEVSDPVETQFGFHLIEVLARKTEDASLERRQAVARQILRERKIEEATEDWLRQIRDRAYVEHRADRH